MAFIPHDSFTMVAIGVGLTVLSFCIVIVGLTGVAHWWLPLFAFLMAFGVTLVIVQLMPTRRD